MWRVTFAGLLAHKIRYVLTALAVMLGVAFMSGTFVLTDTIGRTFDGLFSDVYQNTSAVVRAYQPFTPQANFTSQRSKIDATLVSRIRLVDGVTEIRVDAQGYAQLVGKNGKAIGNPGSGAPTLGQAWNDVSSMNPYRLLPGGYPPRSSSEVVIDKRSADIGNLRVGDQVMVLTKQAPSIYTITGIVRWESADSPLGASITLFDQATAQRVLGEPDKVDEIDVAAAPGVSQQQMAQRLRSALSDPKLEVLTGRQITKEGQDSVRAALSFFNTFLLIFALIALFVGSFLIFNTFSIIVAQRLRELALLRAVGASRPQVMGSVLGESLVIGVLASAFGLGVGIGLAVGLRAMLNAFGIDIPSSGLLITPRTIVISLVAGTLITVLAAIMPAKKADKIAPVAALRDVAIDGETRKVRRTISGAIVTALGLVALFIGLFGHSGNRVTFVGVGAAVVFLGVAILGPLVSRPLSRVIGVPLTWRGSTGQLARSNAMRNPKRTAATALMVGVAVISVMSVIASSMKSTVSAVVDANMRADFVVSAGGQAGGAIGLSPTLQQKLSTLPQVGSSTGVRAGTVRIDGSTNIVLATDPRHVSDLFDIDLKQGDVASMTATGIAISQQKADAKHLAIGQPLKVQFTTTGTKTFTVQTIYGARQLAGDYVLPLAAAEQNFSQQLDYQVYVKLAAGVTSADGRTAIDPIVAHYPTAKLMDRTQFKHDQLAQINQMLNLVYGLLALALFIALIGIANTLALSIHERTRELGLLRAVGMTRPQLRSTVRSESVITALLGAAEGLVVGTLFGWAIVSALKSAGVTQLSVPIVQLVVVAALAALAGVLAAVGPGRRAARLDVLRAITTE